MTLQAFFSGVLDKLSELVSMQRELLTMVKEGREEQKKAEEALRNREHEENTLRKGAQQYLEKQKNEGAPFCPTCGLPYQPRLLDPR